MSPRKRIAGFFLRLVVVYGLFILPWPGLDDAYLAAFRGIGRTLVSEFGDVGRVVFKNERHPQGDWTAVMILANVRDEVAMQRNYQTRYCYLATALTAALVLATPLPWRRRLAALVAGLVLIHLFLAARLWLGLVDGFSEARMNVVHLSPFWKQAVRLGVTVLLVSPESTFVVPVFVWLIVAIRTRDVERFINGRDASSNRKTGRAEQTSPAKRTKRRRRQRIPSAVTRRVPARL